ncbi:MAG: DUF456 domain-containing protein [Phycisphaerae bacterium]|nr:DUF456 domain-containing protein [Gemmatimonadaceae bacterium]
MSIVAAIVLLGVVLLASLLIVPLGLPGLWIMLGAALLYNVLLPAGGIGWVTLGGCGVLVVIAEVLEFTLGARYTKKYGGSRRAGWGSIVGGIVGAIIGVPVPVIGSVIGAFVGAFVGALVGEFTVPREQRGDLTRVATGAVVGRAVAAALKTGIGVVIMVWMLAVAIFGRSA